MSAVSILPLSPPALLLALVVVRAGVLVAAFVAAFPEELAVSIGLPVPVAPSGAGPAHWCLPPEQDAEFVCNMEDVLEVYARGIR